MLHTIKVTCGKVPQYPTDRKFCGPQTQSRQFWRRRTLLPLPGFKPCTLYLVTTPTTQSQLVCVCVCGHMCTCMYVYMTSYIFWNVMLLCHWVSCSQHFKQWWSRHPFKCMKQNYNRNVPFLTTSNKLSFIFISTGLLLSAYTNDRSRMGS
jgi:hypothetical protein